MFPFGSIANQMLELTLLPAFSSGFTHYHTKSVEYLSCEHTIVRKKAHIPSHSHKSGPQLSVWSGYRCSQEVLISCS